MRELTEAEKLSWDNTMVGEFGLKDGTPRPTLSEVTAKRHEKESKQTFFHGIHWFFC